MNRTVRPLLQLLLTGTALTGSFAAGAGELPSGASTVHGGVSISTPSANQMNIQQTTSSAIVNWQGFSIGQGARVDISQPSASSAILNRVTGSAPSTIAGQLNANGQVYLVNPNGVAITRTGTVQAGAFVASTLDTTDQDFKAGKRAFRGTGQSATVSNQGSITVQKGGYVALLGGRVENAGLISVPMGKVGLGAGEQATLDFSGDGFLQVAVPSRKDGSDAALIQHSGQIRAPGGTVVMQAATARDAARHAINLSGLVEARSVSGRSGAIVLGGGEGGTVSVSGRLDTSARSQARQGSTGRRAPARGGDITITGNDIRLSGATLMANGTAGGGRIRVGGDYQGNGPLQRASTTTVDAASTISADAGHAGNGGDVVVWSDQITRFAGRISATGGERGGNGGQAEVSSHGVLAYTGTTLLSAARGSFGTLLLDPYNVTISNGADANQAGFTATGNDSVISAATLQTALRSANVTVTTGGADSPGTQAGDITVAAPLTWGAGTGAATTLTLNAYRSIVIGANLTVNGDGGLALNTNQGGSGGTLSFGTGASASFVATSAATPTQSLTIDNEAYRLVRAQDFATTFPAALLNAASASGRFALADNINAGGTTLRSPINGTPAGANVPFTGKFNGLGHTISNLNITSTNQYVGLLGTAENATIANLRLSNVNVTGRYAGDSDSFVGGLVGQSNTTRVHDVSISGTVTSSPTGNPSFSYTGGLIGQSTGSISQSSSSGTVTGGAATESETGGLVGNNAGAGTVIRSFSSSNVSGSSAGGVSSDTGGLIGWNTSSGTVGQVSATGTVTGGNNLSENSASYTGGLIGYNTGGGPIQQASASGAVRGGQANGTTATGGLIGYLQSGSVAQAYATGPVTGGNAANAAGVGSETGTSHTGGLIGTNLGTLDQTYASGSVTAGLGATVATGGLIGSNGSVDSEVPTSGGTASASFWDTTTTGQAAAAGNAATLAGATGLTTAQFQNATTFVPLATGQGWNFQTTWAPPSAGFYPELYSIARVVSVTADPKTKTYGQANPLLTGAVSGGPGVYVFDVSTAPPSAASLLATSATPGSGVGDYAINPIGTPFVSAGNTSYRVAGTGSTLAVTPAPLTIQANDQSKTLGQTFTFTGTEFRPVGLVDGDQVTRVTLTSQGEPTSAAVGSYPIVASAAQGNGLVNPANNRANYSIAYTDGTLTVNPVPVPPQTPAERASEYANASVTPNISIILPNFTTPPLPLTDGINLSVIANTVGLSGGGPTLGVGSGAGAGDGSSTVASGNKTLAAINTASNALNAKLNACEKTKGRGLGGYTSCVGDSLESFAATLDLRVQQLPPAFRGLPAIIRQAAQRVRTAATVGEARAAVRVAVTAIRKAISLLRADEPAVARIQVRQGQAIAAALRTVDARLSKAVGL